MRRAGLLVALLAAVALPAPTATGQAPQQPTAAPQQRTALPDIEDEVMCVVCGTPLNVSGAPAAEEQRAFIRRLIAEGKTKAEVKAILVTEYGPNVLAVPRSPLAWLIPLGGALAAAAAIAFAVVSWRRRGRSALPASGRDGAEDDDLPPPPSPADAARLDREMAAFDR